MALPGSGQLSLGDIAGEIGLSISDVSLRSMSSTAGFSTPDAVSEFYNYDAYTYYASWYASAYCTGTYYNIYLRANGKYYVDNGGTYALMYSIAETWYEYLYYDSFFDADVTNGWTINAASTVLTDDGLFLQTPCI
jgi:hypothetical protein